jgi:hypothetical protein
MAHFNGTEISRIDRNILLKRQTKKLRELQKAVAHSVRAAVQYVATTTRPDLPASCQLLANRVGVHADKGTYTQMNTLIELGNHSATEGLRYTQLDLSSIRIAVFPMRSSQMLINTSHNSVSWCAWLIVTIVQIL